jgi:membrane fusion protein, multidrug efflux system
MRPICLALLALLLHAATAGAEPLAVQPVTITEWKAVFGLVETRDRVPARARIGGTLVELTVTEGDRVTVGQRIGMVEDTKLSFQIGALDARLAATGSRLATAEAELERGRQLIERGVISATRLEDLQTAVDVLRGEIASLQAERAVVTRQVEEGAILAPGAGIVLDVPVSKGSVITPGEAVATIGGGGVFLRLSVPERHATDLAEGDRIEIGGDSTRTGRLVRLYPRIEGGRVQADVEVEGLDAAFVGLRVPVRLPVGTRDALLVPQAALSREGGLDFVTVLAPSGPLARVVVPGASVMRDGSLWREILAGLAAGETVVTPDE